MMKFLKFSEMSDAEVQAYMKNFEEYCLAGKGGFKYLKPAAEFDKWGLRFPLDYLNTVSIGVIFLPVELMADYVDIVTKTFVDNHDAKFEEFFLKKPFGISEDFENINATSLGNIAYTYLHSNNKEVRDKADVILTAIFDKSYEYVLSIVQK